MNCCFSTENTEPQRTQRVSSHLSVLTDSKTAVLKSKRNIFRILLLFAFFLFTAMEGLQTDPFWELVARSEAVLSAESISDADLDNLILEWEIIDEATHNGRTVAVNTDYIVSALETVRDQTGDERDTESVAALFRTLSAAQASWRAGETDAGGPTIEGVMGDLDAILAEERFNPEEREPLIDWDALAQRFWDWLMQRMPESAPNVTPPSAPTVAGQGVVWVVVALTGLLLFSVLFYLLRGISLGFVRDGSANLRRTIDGELGPLSSKEALQEATNTAEAGDYRTAVRYLYLSTLLTLEDKGLFRYDKSQTNREYIESVSGRPQIAALLRDVVTVFDRVWYGFRSIDQETFNRYRQRIETLQHSSDAAPVDAKGAEADGTGPQGGSA